MTAALSSSAEHADYDEHAKVAMVTFHYAYALENLLARRIVPNGNPGNLAQTLVLNQNGSSLADRFFDELIAIRRQLSAIQVSQPTDGLDQFRASHLDKLASIHHYNQAHGFMLRLADKMNFNITEDSPVLRLDGFAEMVVATRYRLGVLARIIYEDAKCLATKTQGKTPAIQERATRFLRDEAHDGYIEDPKVEETALETARPSHVDIDLLESAFLRGQKTDGKQDRGQKYVDFYGVTPEMIGFAHYAAMTNALSGGLKAPRLLVGTRRELGAHAVGELMWANLGDLAFEEPVDLDAELAQLRAEDDGDLDWLGWGGDDDL